MDANVILAISIGGLNLFVSKCGREADCYYFCATINIPDFGFIYTYRKCRDGRFDDIVNPGCYDELLGCNW
jgi:hypothetical protein